MGEVEIAGYEPLVNDMKRMGEIYSKSSYFADISERTAAVRAFYLGEGHLQAHGNGRPQETDRLCGECMEGKEPGVPHRAFMGSGRSQETDRLCGECMEGKEPGVPHRAFTGHGRPQETDRLCGECMEEGKELLEQTALPVKEIAGRVGYENTTFFYRLFERETGMAPAEWRARDDGGRSVPADRADKRKQEMPGQEEG
ncbi:MAG: AraC family transcriptional regulator [Roseburia sp.]|jgi:hypothetical protein|nr:AraC family transcriptional regulator [Roseburia sp.]